MNVTDVQTSRIRNFFWFQRDPLEFMNAFRDKGDIVNLRTGLKNASYVVNSTQAVREILVTKEASFKKGRSSNILRLTLGQGLLTTEDEQHRKQKKYMKPPFYKQQIQSYAKTISSMTKAQIGKWNEKKVVNVNREMMELTLQIVTETMFGHHPIKKTTQLTDAVDKTIEQTAKRLFAPVALPQFIPTIGNKEHKKAIQLLDEEIFEYIKDAKSRTNVDPPHLLQMLLETSFEDGERLSVKEIRDQMMTILIAGHETTANALSWAFYLLEQNPKVVEAFVTELDEVLNGKLPDYEDFPKLEYTTQIFRETLRLYPPAWIILREACEDVEIGGHIFSKGSIFLISPYAIQRDPTVFVDPLSFRPERFQREKMKEIPSYAYFPFGGGSRGCIGSNFAMMEAVLILAIIGQTYSFQRNEKFEIEPEPLVSLRMKQPFHLNVKKRAKS